MSRKVPREVHCLTCAPLPIQCEDTPSKGPRDSCDYCYLEHKDCKPGPDCPLTARRLAAKLAARKRKAEASPTPTAVPETTRKRARRASQQTEDVTPESEEATIDVDVPSTSNPTVKPKVKKGGKKGDEQSVEVKVEKVSTKPGKTNTSRTRRASAAASSTAAAAPVSSTKSTKATLPVAPSAPTKTTKSVPSAAPVTPTKSPNSVARVNPGKITTPSTSGAGTRQVFECVLITSPSRGRSSQFNAFRPTSRDTVTLGSLATRLDNVEASLRANSASNVNVVKEIREGLKKIHENANRDADAYQQQRLVMRAVAAALRVIQTTNNSPELDALVKALEDEPGGGSDDNGEVAGPSA